VRLSLEVRNLSSRKRLYRTSDLTRLAERVCTAERAQSGAELSVLLCDDEMIRELNHQYRGVNHATDVLSFSQEAPPVKARAYPLGDIVISLETVERQCNGARGPMREEVRFLFCHGLLHLLGYDHATARDEARMRSRQAEYLDIPEALAWRNEPPKASALRVSFKRED